MDNLGRAIRERRQAKELSLAGVAKLSGLSAGCISHIEKGYRFPLAMTLRKLAKPLGFSEVELFKLAGFLSADND